MMNGMAAGCGVMGIVGTVLGGLLALAVLALLVLGIVWLARQLRRSQPSTNTSAEPEGPGAVELLRREYAGGRVDRDEFIERYDDLTTRPRR